MKSGSRRLGAIVAIVGALVAATLTTSASAQDRPSVQVTHDRAYYILPPGNYGGLPTTDQSRDQLKLYAGLTPLRGNVRDADIKKYFLPEALKPIGATRVEPTPRAGTRIVYDSHGVAHITGETRDDLSYGAGWVTARDRGLLLQLGRGPSRAAAADVPGINAFGLVTSGKSFTPSAATEKLLDDQAKLIVTTYGEKGRQIIRDAQAEADGVNAYFAANGGNDDPFTVNDVIATAAFIGSIFGAGGGAEASNAEFLSKLENHLGKPEGRQAWEDAMLFDDPEAPTTIKKRFDYPILTGGKVTGAVTIDEGSIVSLDPTKAAPTKVAPAPTSEPGLTYTQPTYPAAGPVPAKQASNFLIVNQARSALHKNLAVMGPQLGYYYPEIVQQIHLTGPGIDAQGAAVPGLAMYLLLGRTRDYAWSLTSANQDVRDVFAEELCNPDGSAPTRTSTHYLFKGVCKPFEMFDAGTLEDTPIRYPVSVHGPMIGTATSNGKPVALTRQRSTFGRDGLNLAALKDMTEGKGSTPEKFWDAANQFGFTFNWGYASRTATSYFSSGLLPVRAPGLDRRLPTLGSSDYEWQGFLTRDQHPHANSGPGGLLLNWNNKSAPGFMHGDDNPYGSVHRVELFDKFPNYVLLADDVSTMNRAATEDIHSLVWPVVSQVLRTGPAPSALDAKVLDLLDDWVRRDAPLLDADESGQYDEAGPTLMDAVWRPVATAVMNPVYGDLTKDLNDIRNLGGLDGESFVDKDLRTLLQGPVQGKFNLTYCGKGDLNVCRASLWGAIHAAAANVAADQGPDPTAWRSDAARTGFIPNLIPDTFPATNRPTFQQVLEFAQVRPGGR